MLDQFTVDSFAPRVGESFTLRASDGGELELTLAAANAAPEPYARNDERVAFSLIFHGPIDPFAPQGTWRVEHAELGELDIFIVPLGPDGDAMRYEAVFS